jgi:hypothetical protein
MMYGHLRIQAHCRGRACESHSAASRPSSISVTFVVYGHLLPDEQDGIAAPLDQTYDAAQMGLS